MDYLITYILESLWIKCVLCNFQAYRKWYGGRWEQQYIEFCYSDMWFDVPYARRWPLHTSLWVRGTPVIEVYPLRWIK